MAHAHLSQRVAGIEQPDGVVANDGLHNPPAARQHWLESTRPASARAHCRTLTYSTLTTMPCSRARITCVRERRNLLSRTLMSWEVMRSWVVISSRGKETVSCAPLDRTRSARYSCVYLISAAERRGPPRHTDATAGPRVEIDSAPRLQMRSDASRGVWSESIQTLSG